VFQEAVLRAVNKLSSLRERAKFRAWLCSVVVSVHRTRCRRAFWKRLISRDEAKHDPVGDDGARWADDRASARRATAALATLSPPQAPRPSCCSSCKVIRSTRSPRSSGRRCRP